MSSPGVGTQLGNYRLEALLGRGGMGVVYRAVDVRLRRMVALKLLRPRLADDALFRARFLAESRLAASIDHAGIVPIYEAGESDGQLFIAMRYVEGTDLASLLRREGALVPSRAVELVRQLGDALDAAHARGLVHRDVKPSNALVAREGTAEHVYLADFGLTKHIATSEAVTASDQLVGTIDYLAPERILGERADGRADLYSLGCVLFECLTGEVPFGRESDVAAIYAHLEEAPPRPSERRVGVPAALDGVVERALAKDPERRWQSGAELGAAAHAALTRTTGPVPAVVRARRRPAWRFAVAVTLGAALLAILGVLTFAHPGGRPGLAVAAADQVAVIDPAHDALIAEVARGASPSQIAVGAGAAWIANTDAGTVWRIDRHSRQVSQSTPVGSGPSAVAVGAGGIWVVNSLSGTMSWISPVTHQVVDTIPVGNGPSGVCVAAGAVWVALAYDRSILRFDPVTRRRSVTRLDDEPTFLACGGGSVWAASQSSGTVTQVPASGRGEVLGRIPVGNGPSGLAWGFGALWVTNTADGTVSRIDARRGVQSALVPVGSRARPTSVAVGAGGVWVSNENAGTIVRIDPARNQVVRTLTIGNQPLGLTVVDGSLWVGVRASNAQHRGGTLHVLQPAIQGGATGPWTADNVDSANGYNGWGILPLTNDGLVAFRRVGGRQAATLVADLALAIPAPTDGGRTYTFRLRPGVRYSTGATVHAVDIRRGIERLLRRAGVSSTPGSYYAGIDGARRCSPRRCDLSSGVTVDDRADTITFHLGGPDSDFLEKLALPSAVAVAPGVGARISRPLPATGPYGIARMPPPASVILVRNPRFVPIDGRPDGFPDRIEINTGAPGSAPIRAVENGRADFFGGGFGLPAAVRAKLEALGTRYAAQLHTTPAWATVYAFLNTRVAPFDNLDVRRALNYAVDRSAFAALKGGPGYATPTCQFLPPDFPGYRPYCPYTAGAAGLGRGWSAADLARARLLVAHSRTRGMHITVVAPRIFLNSETVLIARLLQRLGYRTTTRSLPENVSLFDYVGDSRHRAQIGVLQWEADYPSGSGYLQPVFSCAAFVPGDASQLNDSEFCDRRTDRLMHRAQRLPFGDPGADALWAAADRRIVDQAAVVPLTNPAAVSFVSRRVGDYQYSPQWGVLYDQLWVR